MRMKLENLEEVRKLAQKLANLRSELKDFQVSERLDLGCLSAQDEIGHLHTIRSQVDGENGDLFVHFQELYMRYFDQELRRVEDRLRELGVEP
jgi:hypothetical protein